jgi:hypothetical protein
MKTSIVSGDPREISGAYIWDTSDLPEGTYWIKAELEYEGLIVSDWSEGSVLVRHTPDEEGDDEFVPFTGPLVSVLGVAIATCLWRPRH